MMKNKSTAYLLCIFLGLLGGHQFYLGKIGKGILYFLTLGIFGIGWLIDLFTLGGQVEQHNTNEELKTIRANALATSAK